MVGHQHVGVQGKPMLAGSLRQTFQIKTEIAIRCENGFAIIATLNHVERFAFDKEPGQAGHTRPPISL
ncbi:hypothetical protein D3C83_53190 [compost metagenome]